MKAWSKTKMAMLSRATRRKRRGMSKTRRRRKCLATSKTRRRKRWLEKSRTKKRRRSDCRYVADFVMLNAVQVCYAVARAFSALLTRPVRSENLADLAFADSMIVFRKWDGERVE